MTGRYFGHAPEGRRSAAVREGLRDGDLERFKAEAMGGLSGAVHRPADQRRIQELERVNAKQEKRLREAEVLLELQKSPRALGGKGRRHDEALRTEIISLLDEAVARGARGEAGLA